MLGILFSKHRSDIHPGKKTLLACWMRNYLVLSFFNFHLDFAYLSTTGSMAPGFPWVFSHWIRSLRRLLFGHFSSLMSSGCCWLQLNVFEPSNWSFLVQKKRIQKRTGCAFQITYLHTIWHPVSTIYTITGTITYPIPIGTFESMIFPTSRLGGICDVSSLEGNPSTWSSWRKRSLEAFF